MFSNKSILKVLTIIAAFTLISSCSDSETGTAEIKNNQPKTIALNVYKSPTCGCCEKWIEHIDANGFQSKIYDRRNISAIKDQNGIEPRYRSCHTAISKEGYIFEGHVPAKFMLQFLNEQHLDTVIGLSVPAMPLGTPGMEVDDKFQPYRILLLKTDGSYETYANVQSYEEQF